MITDLTDVARDAAVTAIYIAMEACNEPRRATGQPVALIPPSLRPTLVDAVLDAVKATAEANGGQK